MIFLAKKRYDAEGNDLAPETARKNNEIFIQHIELSKNTEGAILATEEDELLTNPLIKEKLDLVEIANAVLEDMGV
jgi:hypothetical protein